MARIIGNGGDNDLEGSNNADHIRGLAGDDTISGNGGDDFLYGGQGNDYVWGSDGFDNVFGGAGDDFVVESDGGGNLYGGKGFDTLSLSYLSFFSGGHGPVNFTFDPAQGPITTPDGSTAYSVERLDATGSNFDDVFKGWKYNDQLDGWDGNDRLVGRDGDDFLIGSNGNDKLYGGPGNDRLWGGGNNDALYGGTGDDVLVGGGSSDVFTGDDVLEGGPGADTFMPGLGHTDITYAHSKAGVYADLVSGHGFGGDAEGDIYDARFSLGFHGKLIGSDFNDWLAGGDQMYGGNGDDTLVSGFETSIMEGGAGHDTFKFVYPDFQFGAPHVTDFDQAGHELLDVSGIDARRPAFGDQAFRFIGTDAFSDRVGELRYDVDGGHTVIQMNTDHDADPEYSIVLDGVFTLTAADFAL